MDRITAVDLIKSVTVPLEERHEHNGYNGDLAVVLYEDGDTPRDHLRIYTAGLSRHVYIDVMTGDPAAANEPYRWDVPRWEEAARFHPEHTPFEVIAATITNLVEARLADAS